MGIRLDIERAELEARISTLEIAVREFLVAIRREERRAALAEAIVIARKHEPSERTVGENQAAKILADLEKLAEAVNA